MVFVILASLVETCHANFVWNQIEISFTRIKIVSFVAQPSIPYQRCATGLLAPAAYAWFASNLFLFKTRSSTSSLGSRESKFYLCLIGTRDTASRNRGNMGKTWWIRRWYFLYISVLIILINFRGKVPRGARR